MKLCEAAPAYIINPPDNEYCGHPSLHLLQTVFTLNFNHFQPSGHETDIFDEVTQKGCEVYSNCLHLLHV